MLLWPDETPVRVPRSRRELSGILSASHATSAEQRRHAGALLMGSGRGPMLGNRTPGSKPSTAQKTAGLRYLPSARS